MDEASSFPYEFPSHNYQTTMFDDHLAENQQGYHHMGQFADAFPEDNTMAGAYLGSTSLGGMPHAPAPHQAEPSPLVLPGSHIPFAHPRDNVLSQQQQQQQHEHQRLVGVPQQEAFMMESPNLSTGSSTTPETFLSGPLITPEDHPQQRLSSKSKSLESNTTTPRPPLSTFQQYTVPPAAPPPRKATQQRQPRQQQQARQRQRQRPAAAVVDMAPLGSPGDFTPSRNHWQKKLPDGDLATGTKTAAALSRATPDEDHDQDHDDDAAVTMVDAVEELRKCRNRVAANKCRQKKKASAAQLEGRNAALQHHNARLADELGSLKREFAGLHETLMGHYGCGDVNIDTYIQNRAASIATAAPAAPVATTTAQQQQLEERRRPPPPPPTQRYEMMIEMPMFATQQGPSSTMMIPTPTPNSNQNPNPPSSSRMQNYGYEMTTTTPLYPMRASISGATTVGTTGTSSSSSSSPPPLPASGEFNSSSQEQQQQPPQHHRQQEQVQRTGVFTTPSATRGRRTASRVPVPPLHHQHSTISTTSSSSPHPSHMVTQRQYPFYHSGEMPLQTPFGPSADSVFGGHETHGGQHGGGVQAYQQRQHRQQQHGFHSSNNSSHHIQLDDGYHGDHDDGGDDGNDDGADDDGDGSNLGGWAAELLPPWEMPTSSDSTQRRGRQQQPNNSSGGPDHGPGPDYGAGQMNMD